MRTSLLHSARRLSATVLATVLLVAITTVPASAAPAVSSVYPTSGNIGCLVTIGGSGFVGVTAVKFNGTASISYTVDSTSQITARVPSGATTGPVSVEAGGIAAAGPSFTVDASSGSCPSISDFSPKSGPVGTLVTISGSHFTDVKRVQFGSLTASFTFVSDSQLTATVPSGAVTALIRVTNSAGTTLSASAFTVTTAPTITKFEPTSGPVGTVVTITGTNFVGVSAVKFNNVSATTFSASTPTQITATVPATATTGKISVTTTAGTATSSSSFTVTKPPAPTISSFTPTSGPPGTVVTITGTNFVGVSAVKFNNVSATTFSASTPTQITATVPATATTGKITVTTAAGTATSSSSFTVTKPPAPTITSFSPTSGPRGTVVTITGTNFVGVSAVKFNSVSAASFSASSATQVTATVPATATTGKISVTTPGGTATSSKSFTVVTTKPSITSFSPTSGPVGTLVTIKGSSFLGASAVRFNNVAATFSVNSDGTQITATVPSGATTGKISVTTSVGTGTSSGSFTVTVVKHYRSVTLELARHIQATGTVVTGDGYGACQLSVPVRIQRWRDGSWRTVITIQTPTGSPTFAVHIPDVPGTYRAKALKVILADGQICAQAFSETRRHR